MSIERSIALVPVLPLYALGLAWVLDQAFASHWFYEFAAFFAAILFAKLGVVAAIASVAAMVVLRGRAAERALWSIWLVLTIVVGCLVVSESTLGGVPW